MDDATTNTATLNLHTNGVADADLRPLYDLAHLPADWSGHGSRPVAGEAITEAARFIRQVGTPPDFLGPLGNGGVQLEWDGDREEMQLEVHPDGRLSYLVVGPTRVERSHATPEAALAAVRHALAN